MQEVIQSYSFSAPKILGCCNSPRFSFNQGKMSPKISPGVSPSGFAIQNFPIEHTGSIKNQNFFFNSDVPINDLKRLAEITTIEEEDSEFSSIKINELILSKSASQKPLLSPSFFPAKLPHCDENKEKDSFVIKNNIKGPRFVPIVMPQIILQRPPLRPGNVKREKRSTFDNEEISCDRYTGKLKFYNLHKRFGFIEVDNEDFDAFICEDEMLLSGQNLRRFKDDVYKKNPVFFEFHIKKYLNNGVEKWKAVKIGIKNYQEN